MGAIENIIEIVKPCAPYWTALIKDTHVTEQLLISGTKISVASMVQNVINLSQ
jgi:hypothetical protein